MDFTWMGYYLSSKLRRWLSQKTESTGIYVNKSDLLVQKMVQSSSQHTRTIAISVFSANVTYITLFPFL